MTVWLWLLVSSVAYVLMARCILWALRPKSGTWQPHPDWFWDQSAGRLGSVHGTYEEFRQEPSDQPESKPTSGAG